MIGNRLAKYREKAGLSQSQLGDILYVKRQTISSWETDRTEPSIDMLKKISDELGIDIDLLIYNERGYGVDKQQIRILRSVNILFLAVHTYFCIIKGITLLPVLIAPFLAFSITIIMSIIFHNNFKSGDYSIIAGYNPEKDTHSKVKKQLDYILLLSSILSILSSIIFLGIYFIDKAMIMPYTMLVFTIYIIGLTLIIWIVNKKIVK